MVKAPYEFFKCFNCMAAWHPDGPKDRKCAWCGRKATEVSRLETNDGNMVPSKGFYKTVVTKNRKGEDVEGSQLISKVMTLHASKSWRADHHRREVVFRAKQPFREKQLAMLKHDEEVQEKRPRRPKRSTFKSLRRWQRR